MTKRKRTLVVTLCLLVAIGLAAYGLLGNSSKRQQPEAIQYPPFSCSYEKDHTPPISAEAERYYQQALALDKGSYLPVEQLHAIEQNYQKAVALGHWKAMNNLASLYLKAKYSRDDLQNGNALKNNPTGIKPNRKAALALYAKMTDLKVPQGYYNWYIAINRGWVTKPAPNDGRLALTEAARLGSPLAQVKLGNYFAFVLPKEQQRDDLAEQYFRCAGAQDNPQALIEVAQYYKIAKENMPRALHYLQKATSLGNEDAVRYLKEAFSDEAKGIYNFGYQPDPELAKKYRELYYQLRKNPDLRFPNLMDDYPLPKHPTQGYDADNPEVRPE